MSNLIFKSNAFIKTLERTEDWNCSKSLRNCMGFFTLTLSKIRKSLTAIFCKTLSVFKGSQRTIKPHSSSVFELLFAMVLFTICLISCQTNNQQEPALTIGQYTLSASDLEAKRKSEKYKSLTDQALQDKLIEEGRILAFSLDHKYDTITYINKLVDYASRAYAARVDGFVWNKKVKPKLQLTEKDIKDAYQKRSQELMVEVVQVQNKNVLYKYFTAGKNFNALKMSASSDKSVKAFTVLSRFPHSPLSIYVSGANLAKAGDVLGPAETEDGYIVARVVAIRPLNQNPYEQEKEKIKEELLAALIRKHTWESEKDIFSKAKPEINDAALGELASKFNAKDKSWPGVDPKLRVMNYILEDKRVSYTASDFEEFVKNEPVFFGSLSNPADLKKMLRFFITEQYLFADAQQMNIQADEEYLRFRRAYKEKILMENYKKTHIYPKLSVQPKEMEDYYQNNSYKFKAFESASVTVYKFKDMRKAFMGGNLLKRQIAGAPIAGPVGPNAHRPVLPQGHTAEIKVTDRSHDPKLIKTILMLKPGQTSSPIEINGEYVIVVLAAKKGVSTLPYTYVKEDIEQILKSQKEKQLSTQGAKELKAKYPVKKNKILEHLSKA